MEFIFLAGGVVLGSVITTLVKNHSKIYGVLDIDHDTQQCRSYITSEELLNRKTKKALFKINHDAKISREEQTLL